MRNSDQRLDALEVSDELVEAIADAGTIGLTIKEASRLTGIHYMKLYQIILELECLGRLRVVKICGRKWLVLPSSNAQSRDFPLTYKQEKLLAFLSSAMDENNMVRVSIGRMSAELGIKTSCQATVDALDVKGYLEIRDKGGPTRPRLYEIFPDASGPKGHSAIWFATGRPIIHEWDEVFLDELREEIPWIDFDDSCEQTDKGVLRNFAAKLAMITRNEERQTNANAK